MVSCGFALYSIIRNVCGVCSAPLGRESRVESHATKVPKGWLPDLIAKIY